VEDKSGAHPEQPFHSEIRDARKWVTASEDLKAER